MYPVIEIFNRTIPTFGILFLFGTCAAFLLSTITARKYAILTMDIVFCGLFGIIGGIIGAKSMYLLVNLSALIQDPLNTLIAFLSGGSVFFGGLLGGVMGGYFYTRIYKLNPILFFDAAVPCLSLAQAFGRIGCFFNGCCYGIGYDGFCSVTFPEGAYPPAGVSLFPTQLTESLFLFILSGLLLWHLKKSRKPGHTTGLYLISYGIFRFLIEFLRADPRGSFLCFSTSQWLGLLVVLAGILFFKNIPQNLYKNSRKF
ncbi:prolipoprotein diacylglyceryl transferase [Eubacteriaceae bacterium ES2]|nr:prolipoprotein diacylglyceryl transferase [Eubacteriaceae bacterium ES2]